MKETWLHLVDPLVKIVATTLLTGAVFLLDEPRSTAVLVAGGLLLVLAGGGLRRGRVLCVAALSLASLGGVHLLIGGTLEQAAVTVGRVATLIAVGGALALTTDPAELLRSLQGLPIPAPLRLGMHVTWRSVGVLHGELGAIRFAAALEGRTLSVSRPAELFRFGLLPLAFRMTAFADEMTLALHSRGITLDGRVRGRRRRAMGRLDALFVVYVLAVVAGAGGVESWS